MTKSWANRVACRCMVAETTVENPKDPTISREASVREGDHRHAQARKTIRADLAGKAVATVVRLVSIPLSIQLLGAERYGLWLTVSSVLMWLNLSQLGLGGGLLNELGRASAGDDRARMQRLVSTAYAGFALIAVLVFCLIVLSAQTPLAGILVGVGKSPDLAGEARKIFLVAGGLFAVSLVTNAIGPVCMGLQQGYVIYSSFMAGSLLSLGALTIVYWTRGSLLAFCLAMTVPTLATNLCISAYVFYRLHPDLRPRLRWIDGNSRQVLLATGGALAVVQLGELTALQAASPLIANGMGLAVVPQFAVPFSILMMAASLCQGLATAYQAAFAQAAARSDWAWIAAAFTKSRRRGLLLITSVAVAFTVVGPWLIPVWTRGQIQSSHALLAAMGVYFALMVVSMQNSVLMVGLGEVRRKAILQTMIAVAHVAGFLLLVPLLGLFALPVAGGLGFVVDVAVTQRVTHKYLARARSAGSIA
ncbi:MAG: hypothetical protein JNN08_27295 [Bryobacterales bacterium]|nr:hypothetical protein [Bryobacterales bacterium]